MEEEEAEEPKPESEPEEQAAATDSTVKVDQSYYEKASKLLDESVSDSAEEGAASAEEKSDSEIQKPISKSASASLEDLMRLMEEEQKRLRDQLNK